MPTQFKHLLIQLIQGLFSLGAAYFCFTLLDSTAEGGWEGWKFSGGIAGFFATWFAFNKFWKDGVQLDHLELIEPSNTKSEESREVNVTSVIHNGFSKGISVCVDTLDHISELDIICLTSGSYYQQLFEDRPLTVGKIRIVLPTENAIDLFYKGTGEKLVKDSFKSANLVKSEIEITLQKWKDLVETKRAASVEIRYVDFVPSFYLSGINSEKLLTGFYILSSNEGNFNGFELDCSSIEDSTDRIKLVKTEFSNWFESLWKASSSNFSPNKQHGEFFEYLANTYKPSFRYDDKVIEKATSIIADHFKDKSIKLLDVGSGFGTISRSIFEATRDCDAHLLDISPTMLGFASSSWGDRDLPPKLILGDAEEGGGLHQEYDLIVISAVLHLLKYPFEYLKIVSDKLSRDGAMLILTYDDEDLENFLFYRYFPGFKEVESSRMVSAEGVINTLRSQGLKVINSTREPYLISFENANDLNSALMQRQFSALSAFPERKFKKRKKEFLATIKERFNNGPIESQSSVSMIIATK